MMKNKRCELRVRFFVSILKQFNWWTNKIISIKIDFIFEHPFPTLSLRARFHSHILCRFIVGQISAISQAKNYLRRHCEKWIKHESNRRYIYSLFFDNDFANGKSSAWRLWGRQPAAVAMILALAFQLLRASLTSEIRRVSIGLEEVCSQTHTSECVSMTRTLLCFRQIKRAVKLQWSESELIILGSLVSR